MATVLDRKTATRDATATKMAARARMPRPKAVTVNGVTIPRGDIARETQHHPADKPVDAWLAAARALVVRELLLQEARRLGIESAPLEDEQGRRETSADALVRQLVEREVRTPEPDEATCRRVYEQKTASFRSPDLYAVRHILIPADPADAAARSDARRHAKALIDEIVTEPALFPALALAHSACPSRRQGGALGQISRGQTVPEFEAALTDAPVGSVITEPVETRYGVHVVVVDQKIAGARLPFDMVEARIAAWLAQRSREAAIRQYIAMLAGQASIVGIELEAAHSPLGQ